MVYILNDSTTPTIVDISFSEISDFWIKHLWPGRLSEIEPVSCINSNGQINIDLKKYHPIFLGLVENNIVIGVVSVCQTDTNEYRLRGICIISKYRNRGYSSLLVSKAFTLALSLTTNPIFWTLAREKNFSFYQKFDFIEHKRISNFEFGPHIILKNYAPLDTYKKLSSLK